MADAVEPGGVLFDVDGTLVDTAYVHAMCWGEALRQGGHDVPMATVHRAIGMGSAELLDHLHADDVIAAATSSSDADSGKPHPDILQAALARSGLAAQRVVFVGDAVWDGHAARRAGVPFVGVTCGGTSSAELREAGAVEVWQDPADLLAHFADSALRHLLG